LSPCWNRACSLAFPDPWPIQGRASEESQHRQAVPRRECFPAGVHAFAKGYGSSYWLTFNQAKERGGNVKKGEKSSMVVFWKQYETTDKETGQPTTVPVMRYYNVFNAEQLEGIEIPDAVKFEPIDFVPIDEAEKIAAGYAGGPAVAHDGGQQAFYRPTTDTVHMPETTRFASVEEYYSTLFHELSHSSGHSSRLDRKLDTEPKPFGSADYGKEELVAEMSAAFLCSHAGIQPTVIENQAAYLSDGSSNSNPTRNW
jgi:antirestriction protein ArdC